MCGRSRELVIFRKLIVDSVFFPFHSRPQTRKWVMALDTGKEWQMLCRCISAKDGWMGQERISNNFIGIRFAINKLMRRRIIICTQSRHRDRGNWFLVVTNFNIKAIYQSQTTTYSSACPPVGLQYRQKVARNRWRWILIWILSKSIGLRILPLFVPLFRIIWQSLAN